MNVLATLYEYQTVLSEAVATWSYFMFTSFAFDFLKYIHDVTTT